jgi:hypothetical protein
MRDGPVEVFEEAGDGKEEDDGEEAVTVRRLARDLGRPSACFGGK